jgi:ABC-type iron transport system FetAB permease component
VTTASRILGSVALLCALGALALQAAVVAILWTQFREVLAPTSVLWGAVAASVLGLLLCVVALAVDRWRPSAVVVIAGLANLGVVTAGVWVILTSGAG